MNMICRQFAGGPYSRNPTPRSTPMLEAKPGEQERKMRNRYKIFIACGILSCFVSGAQAIEDPIYEVSASHPSQVEDLFIADAQIPAEESAAEGAKKSKKASVLKNATSIAVKAVATKIPLVKAALTFTKGVDRYAKSGWLVAALTSKGPGPGPYPGFKAAVIDPVVAKIKKK